MEIINACLDYSAGFGGKYGVQKGKFTFILWNIPLFFLDRQDKVAHNWDEHEKVEPHQSVTGKLQGNWTYFNNFLQITKLDLVESSALPSKLTKQRMAGKSDPNCRNTSHRATIRKDLEESSALPSKLTRTRTAGMKNRTRSRRQVGNFQT
jgi:hypothetical protein